MADIQSRLEGLSTTFTKLQEDLQEAIASRQKLERQREENLMVQKEFVEIQEGETIFKQVGPVLVKQDKIEAESTVSGRLEFIGKEIIRSEGKIKEVQKELEKIKVEIIQIQAGAQPDAAKVKVQG